MGGRLCGWEGRSCDWEGRSCDFLQSHSPWSTHLLEHCLDHPPDEHAPDKGWMERDGWNGMDGTGWMERDGWNGMGVMLLTRFWHTRDRPAGGADSVTIVVFRRSTAAS